MVELINSFPDFTGSFGDKRIERKATQALNEAGVTSANVDEMKAKPPTPAIATMLGVTPGVGKRLGLSDDWAYQVIKQVGNYDEIWERDLGKGSAYGLERGVNGLIKNGGILYSLTMD